jgi:DNA-binding MarR family transcriptional regulator
VDKVADRLSENAIGIGSGGGVDERRVLQVLDAVSENERITQRSLASQLGIAVGLANLCVKRLARKGYIKCVNVPSNRMLYLITPKGIAEKTRLTYEFVHYSLHLYRRVRLHLASVLRPLLEGRPRRIAIYGRDEAAGLAYLSLKEFGLEPVAIFDGRGGGTFIGMTVQSIEAHADVAYDFLIVATLDRTNTIVEGLLGRGVPRSKLLLLRQERPLHHK